MNPQRPNVEELFLEAVQKDPAERRAFLEASCIDGKVRTRVVALLKAHDSAGNFLETPAVQPSTLASSQNPRAHDADTTSPWSTQEHGEPHETLNFLDRYDTPNRLGLLAHYEILEILGRGGMGLVLRGVDVKLNRVVAIKVLVPQLAADAMARQRFRREAQAAAAVSHHHVVTIHAVDEFHGLPYLVMEYVSGSSLQQKIDGGGLQLTQILRIGTQVASGLAAAHAQGLVHRDIKPANILLENGVERVKITDFGLARGIDDVRMTQAGVVYGTPLYMSPEQAEGERVDHRSDLFSLGTVMYAMCAGRPPFRGESSIAVLKRVCADTPRPIREVNPEIPESLVKIVDKLLAKNPDARFQSAGEVADLLSRHLAHLRHDPLTPFQGEEQPDPLARAADRPNRNGANNGRPEQHAARSRLRWPLFVGAAVVLMAIAVMALLERAHITNWTGLATPIVPSAHKEAAALPTVLPVKVFVLAGDYNMAGRAKVSLLQYQANQAETKERFQHLLQDGKWVVREDVWIKNFQQKGNLTVGFGQFPDRFGPELEFGNIVGDFYDEQVLLIKTCCGDRLGRDFRPPSCPDLPPQKILELLLKDLQQTNASATMADLERSFGAAYRKMVKEVKDTLANLGAHFPSYQGQGYELAGFVWFQAWNEVAGENYNPCYADHLAHFIRDVRRDLQAPRLPFIIGQLGVYGGNGVEANDLNIRTAQAAVAQLPEFTGTVKLVATDPYWDHEAHAVYLKGSQENKDEWDRVGSDAPYRYLGSAKTFCGIGKAFGQAMIELRRSATKN